MSGGEQVSRTGRRAAPAGLGLAVGGLLLVAILLAAALLAFGQGRGWMLAAASARLGRPVHVDGQLSLSPRFGGLTVRFTGLHVDQPAWAGPGPMLAIDNGLVALPWTALLGAARLDDVELDGVRLALKREAGGRANWTSNSSEGHGGRATRPVTLGRLVVQGGVVDLRDAQRATSFHGEVAATAAHGASAMTLAGAGRVQARAWTLRMASTQAVFSSARYGLSVRAAYDGQDARSAVSFDGDLDLAHAAHLIGRLRGSGPDLHALAALTNLPLPRTPPYSLAADADITAKQVTLGKIAGRIGASDIAGSMTIAPTPGGRRLDADLTSRSLRITDLFAVASGGELTGPRAPGQLLPDAAINAAPLRKLTGLVRLTALSVQPPTTPTIHALTLAVRFEAGRIITDPLALQLARGQGVVRSVLDVRGPTPTLRFDADLKHADTGEVFKAAGAPIQARFNARMSLTGAGRSLAAMAAHANGTIALEALDGRLQAAPADVLSADFVRAVISLLTRSQSNVQLRCAVARFQLADGHAQARRFRLSTDLGGVDGQGGFNLAQNTIDLTLRPTGALSSPTFVRIVGPLAHPKATLAMDHPGHVVAKALNGLAHLGAPKPGGPRTCS